MTKVITCRRDVSSELPSACSRWESDDTVAILACNRAAPESAFWLWNAVGGRLERLVVPYPEEAATMAEVISNRPPERWQPPSRAHVDYLARYQLSPHTALATGPGRLVCGQLAGLNTYLLDTRAGTYAPLCRNEPPAWAYSPTPGLSPDGDRLFTARWQVYNDGTPADATHYSEIVSIDLRDGCETVHSRTPIADNVHEVEVLPDGRHVLLNEFMTGLNGSPHNQAGTDPLARLEALRKIGIRASRMALVDLQTGDCATWTCPWPAPAHVVADPDDPAVFYLACHNMVINAGVMYLFGPGCLVKLRVQDGRFQVEGHYTHAAFHRLSTHEIVTCRGRKAIAVTVYPNRCELIDAERFTRLAVIDLYPIARLDAGGLQVPDNQIESAFSVCGTGTEDLLILSGSRRIYVVDLRPDPPHVESLMYNADPKWVVRAHMARMA
jgi:hypothetical protein